MNSPDLSAAIVSTSTSNVKLLTVNLVLISFIGTAAVAGVLCTDSLSHGATVILWALACLAVGALFGLLFGVPRPRPISGAPSEASGPTSGYQPNNNLIEISDWLTKIIVGVGLIELTSLPEKLKMMASPLADCLRAECGLAIAVGIIVYFTTSGFLAGYINARTFIAVMLKESDDQLQALEAMTDRATQEEAYGDLQLIGKREANAPTAAADTAESETESRRAGPDPELLRMAADYEGVRDSDYRKRVSAKDQIAADMAAYLVRKNISKSRLLAWIEAQSSDGLIIAFASYVIARPEPEDLPKLLRASAKARLLHVKYRVALSLRALFRLGYGSPAEWKDAVALLEDYRDHARGRHDSSLLSVTDEVIELIKSKQR